MEKGRVDDPDAKEEIPPPTVLLVGHTRYDQAML